MAFANGAIICSALPTHLKTDKILSSLETKTQRTFYILISVLRNIFLALYTTYFIVYFRAAKHLFILRIKGSLLIAAYGIVADRITACK